MLTGSCVESKGSAFLRLRRCTWRFLLISATNVLQVRNHVQAKNLAESWYSGSALSLPSQKEEKSPALSLSSSPISQSNPQWQSFHCQLPDTRKGMLCLSRSVLLGSLKSLPGQHRTSTHLPTGCCHWKTRSNCGATAFSEAIPILPTQPHCASEGWGPRPFSLLCSPPKRAAPGCSGSRQPSLVLKPCACQQLPGRRLRGSGREEVCSRGYPTHLAGKFQEGNVML